MLLVLMPASATNYIWLHGMEGHAGANTWDIYNQEFTKTNGKIYEYKSLTGIKKIAENLSNTLKIAGDTSKQVIIGHSMGGLVARSVQQITPGITGLITVGTANNGSVAVENVLSGRTINQIALMIAGVSLAFDASILYATASAPPVSTLAAPVIVPLTLVKNILMLQTLGSMNAGFNSLVNTYAFTHQCIYDMKPNSAYLKDINSKKIDIPIINIYGAEDNWQIIRALGALSRVKDVKNPLNIDKTFDMDYVQGVRVGMGYVSQIQNLHNSVYNTLAVPAVFMPWIWITRELILKARYNWDKIYWDLETGMHAKLAVNLGAVGYKYQNYCIPSGYSLSKLVCTSKYLPYVTDNDGILAGSSSMLPDSVSRDAVYNIRVEEVNHQEMGNHPKMRKTFEKIIKLKFYGKAFAD
jgi:pimeloyl-ACP methyl ester carboxylesterase